MFPARFSQRVKCVKSCSTRVENTLFQKLSPGKAKPIFSNRIVLKSVRKHSKLHDILYFLRNMAREWNKSSLAQLALKTRFWKKYLQRRETHFFSIDCLKIFKKILKFAWYPMFPEKLGQRVIGGKSCSTRAENAVLQIVSAEKPKPIHFNRLCWNL